MDKYLATQVENQHTLQNFDKVLEKEQFNASKGFEFEWYSRHPKMQAANVETCRFQKAQTAEDFQRKQVQIIENKKKPSSVLTPEEYDKIAKENKRELYEEKKSQEKQLKEEYDHATKSARLQAQKKRDQILKEENEKLEANRKFIESQNLEFIKNKQLQNTEMNSTITALDQRKRAEWNKKVNDKSNIARTKDNESEKQRLKDDLKNERIKMKQEYSKDLAKQSHYNKERRSRAERDQKVVPKGFNFE